MSQEELLFARQDADMQRDRANKLEDKVQELHSILNEKERENQNLANEITKLQEIIISLREENRILKEQLKPCLDQIESPKIKRMVLKRGE